MQVSPPPLTSSPSQSLFLENTGMEVLGSVLTSKTKLHLRDSYNDTVSEMLCEIISIGRRIIAGEY